MAGGAGYVLSKEALKRFATKAVTDSANCRQDSEGLDYIEIERCLHNVGVTANNTVVADGGTFFPLTIKEHLFGVKSENVWYLMNDAHKVNNVCIQCNAYKIFMRCMIEEGLLTNEILHYSFRLLNQCHVMPSHFIL